MPEHKEYAEYYLNRSRLMRFLLRIFKWTKVAELQFNAQCALLTATLEEGNKLIAEFMGLIETEPGYLYNDQFEKAFLKDYLGYNSSWDWLMVVVEKIEQSQPEGFNTMIELRRCYIECPGITIEGQSNNSKIEAVFNAVCEYITWINENK